MTRGSVPETRRMKANDGEDRISVLPDEIIGHILSSLPTKKAVATSILSKRWRYLWTHITNFLFFDYGKYPSNFDKFVDRVLHLCVSKQIQRFYLCTYRPEFYQVKTWINEAIRRNVQELDLSLLEFPSSVFTCKTLTVMKLHAPNLSANREYEIPTSFYLPSLRILVMKGFLHHSNYLTGKLFRSCPVLEDLLVHAIGVGKEDSSFHISAPVLKRLKFRLHVNGIFNCKFVINAPNLEYMDIYDRNMTDYKVKNLSSIAKVKVDVGGRSFNGDANANGAIELLRVLTGVKSLSLSDYTVRIMDHAYQNHLPIFLNMTQLELIIYEHDGWKILPRLLEVSPKLKVLILNETHMRLRICSGNSEDASGASDSSEQQNIPECLSSCLELVQIEGFNGNGYELKVVEYLLVHAAGLKKLTINSVRMALETAVKVRQKLSEFPRISRSCQVYFLGDLLSSF